MVKDKITNLIPNRIVNKFKLKDKQHIEKKKKEVLKATKIISSIVGTVLFKTTGPVIRTLQRIEKPL
jgi:hypothetical protein